MALSRLLLGVVLLSAAHLATADDPEASLEGVTDLSRHMHWVMRLTLLLMSLHDLKVVLYLQPPRILTALWTAASMCWWSSMHRYGSQAAHLPVTILLAAAHADLCLHVLLAVVRPL